MINQIGLIEYILKNIGQKNEIQLKYQLYCIMKTQQVTLDAYLIDIQ